MSITATTTLAALDDETLLERVRALADDSRRVEADLIAHLAEVETRGLMAKHAAGSLFSYCREILNLSESEAYLRIAVARASRAHPTLLDMLADGRLHLTGAGKLAPHLTVENRDRLLARATRQSKRRIEELIAELCPQPDVPARIRKLPERPAKPHSRQLRPDAVGRIPGATPASLLDALPDQPPGQVGTSATAVPSRVPPQERQATSAAAGPPQTASSAYCAPPRISPLAPSRFKVQFTASSELREKLERLQELMRSSVPGADLAAVIEAAVTEKLERLEAPRKTLADTDTSPSSRKVPAAVRRAVYERDGGRCTFVDAEGRRCTERHRLEYHHAGKAWGRGGDHSLRNVRLACPVHNQHLADLEYGKAWMEACRRRPERAPESYPT
jgi:hypothetical protein